MNSEMYNKLVDLYAGGDLPKELADDLEAAAFTDKDLAQDMLTLKGTVTALRQDRGAEFTEESYQRILMKLYASGAPVETQAPPPMHMQYSLPIAG
jgi:hypothetical protein